MENVEFRFPDGNAVQLILPATVSEAPSTFIFGIKKGGSTLLANVMRDIAPYCERTLFEYPRLVFAEGIAESTAHEDRDRVFLRAGYIFGVFRWLPESDILQIGNMIGGPQRRKQKILLLVRDPRDALVSLYYSDAKSHTIPRSGPLKAEYEERRKRLETIALDEYVLEQAPVFMRHYYRTMQLLAVPETTILRYEDIVYDKKRLVWAAADIMEALGLSEGMVEKIADAHDRFPEEEHESSHIRQVHPGNHSKKLRKDTISALDEMFAPILDYFSYTRSASKPRLSFHL